MKLLATLVFAGFMAIGTTACAKEEPKKEVAAAAVAASEKEGPGKGEMKEVCNDKKDKAGKVINGKDGKPLQICKQIKVRKKVEGTVVPDGKKK